MSVLEAVTDSSAVRARLDDDRTIAWLFVAPALVLLGLVAIYPFAMMIYNSLFDFTQAGRMDEFVGLANYVRVLTDGRFTSGAVFTVGFVLVVVTAEFLLGLGMSLLIYSEFVKRRQIWVVLSLPPMMLSPVVTGLTWRMLLTPEYGMVNHLLGIEVAWLASRPWSAVAVVVADVWMWTPLFVLVFTATIQSIPAVYYEAARVDGMSRWQQFKWVTLPQMRTAIAIVLLLRVVRAFKVFPKIQVLTLGGPGSYTESIAMVTYNYGFRFFDLGRANAAGVLYWLLMFVAAYLIFRSVAEDLISPGGEG
ncbi:carbohydrate ABC transporter permease [Candidatus Halobonum tyrrellensis]|uniref:Binding-protein-dependent transport systems inner membrane component n=1 Tax=Candidatus Halobonum tyrrellensis G22 TaxID=1324957 RepID=V4H9K9_9EURY|nr:sugar ABC transporter permease [Candidatus Halobonum tyrrellensis]ESP87365.1 binding-protein-dependent transport systems inner membrane component [Candidatus Halobonum tyrrellensis G22]